VGNLLKRGGSDIGLVTTLTLPSLAFAVPDTDSDGFVSLRSETDSQRECVGWGDDSSVFLLLTMMLVDGPLLSSFAGAVTFFGASQSYPAEPELIV
jgi:hypothetical protein